MSSLSTREILTVLDKAEYLRMSIRTQKTPANSGLGDVLSVLPSADGSEGPRQFDWDQAQTNNMDLLEHGVLGAKEASTGHRVAKIRVTEAARDRNTQATGLRTRHRSLQSILRGSCGPESLELVGLDVAPVEARLALREQYGLIFVQMRDPALPAKLAVLAQSFIGGTPPDVDALVADMATDLQAYEAAQDRWTRAKKVSDRAYAAKQEALRRLNRLVVNVARIQEGYYRMAGLDDLADRMRLTIRGSKSKKQAPVDSADGSDPDDVSPSPSPATDDSTTP